MASKKLDGERLELKYVPITSITRWDRNKKRHDLGGIIQSIRLHGFKDPMKFEPTLNEGEGGFVEGNGRDEALMYMYNEWVAAPEEKKPAIPRGVGVDIKGVWHIPVLFGVDAPSREAAEAYGFDHNNLTLLGGDFSLSDVMKLWEGDAEIIIAENFVSGGIAPVTIDGDALDAMLNPPEEFTFADFQIKENDGFVSFQIGDIRAKISVETAKPIVEAIMQMQKENIPIDDILIEVFHVE